MAVASLTFLQSFSLNLRSDFSDIQAHEFRGFESTFMACCELKDTAKNIVDDKNICFHCISCSQPSALGINQLNPVCLEKNVAFQSINVNTVLLISDDNVPLLCRLVLAEREDLSASG